jgi:hypothetical protein
MSAKKRKSAGVIEELFETPRVPPTGVATTQLPFETEQLRLALKNFLDQPYLLPGARKPSRLGSVKWGAYAFFDYDNEPIYVGQTRESLGTRIRRHLTNQRTDAVSMKVLDPYEVHTIKVWPLPQFQSTSGKDKRAGDYLNALEYVIYQQCLKESSFGAVLNEKIPVKPATIVPVPLVIEGRIVSDEVSRLRDHPDLRIARRASTIAKLAQVVCERKVHKGLRLTLLAQARRLNDLAQRRYDNSIDQDEDDE